MKDDTQIKATAYKKVTIGFVVQDFVKNDDGSAVCVSQSFIASDQVEYEDELGEPVEVDTGKEICYPFDMIQPQNNTLFKE